MLFDSTSIPVSGKTIDSGPPHLVAMTGNPALIASTRTPPKVFGAPPELNVFAITEDGTVVNRKNLAEYMTADCVTI